MHARERERRVVVGWSEREGDRQKKEKFCDCCAESMWTDVGWGVGGECQTPARFFHCLIKRRADKLAVPSMHVQAGNCGIQS